TLTWVGDGTGVSQSSGSFYSEDYGKSFHDVSHAIKNTFIKKDFGISAGPGNPQQVNKCTNMALSLARQILITNNIIRCSMTLFSVLFHCTLLSFVDIISLSFQGGLWLSQDFGNSWSKVHEGVHTFTWSSSNFFLLFFFFQNIFYNFFQSDTRRGKLILRRTQDFGKTFTTIAKNVFSFRYIGGFLFTSVMEKLSSPRVIYVSSDQGDHLQKAQLPSTTTEQFYSVLDGDEDMIFMHVDSPGDTYFGTIYTSDDRGILYSKSLERHLFGGEGKSDFTNVTSLRGVYFTNILEEDGRIRSVISFDRGRRWRFLKKPENVNCSDSSKKCNLHIHGEHSHFSGITPMLPLSEPAAIGLVIAHGSVGDSISAVRPDVYVSGDGGYTWWGTLRGPHHYTILDSGGLIVAVEAHRDRQISSIKFSTDEGQCWKIFNFTSHPIFLAGLASEPGTKTMNISIFGYRPDDDDQPIWVAVTIDFEHLLTRECDEQDYVQWLAHSDYDSDPETDGCLLGYKETFRRLKKLSACRNGRGYVVSRQQHPCPCTRDDYMCEYGFYLHENTSECLLQPDFLNLTQYRKIPGDKCEGGFSPPRREGEDILPASSNSHTVRSVSGPFVMTVIIYYTVANKHEVKSLIILILYWSNSAPCRSPAYRFSVLQLQDDDLCGSNDSSPNSKLNGFQVQEDSDDVSLMNLSILSTKFVCFYLFVVDC
uniref:Si:dkey-159a18.1 n=1 Tax=Cyprinus carpio TaxID=7962 RepID=A0A8C2EZK9_CYPCA